MPTQEASEAYNKLFLVQESDSYGMTNEEFLFLAKCF